MAPAYSSRVLADVHQHSEAGQRADQAATAVADHGERDAFGGHHPQHHAHVHEALDNHDHGQAQGEIASEIVVDAQGGADAAPENHDETEQQSGGTDQAQLFAGHRVNEILVGFGAVEDFLAASHEAVAYEAAGAHRDLGLLELVVGVPGDQRFLEPGLDGALPIEFLNDLELRVEEHHNAGQTVGFGEDEEYQAYHGERADDGAVAFLQSGDEEDQPRGGAQHDGGTEIGHHHRQDDEADRHRGGHQGVARVIDGARAPGDEERQEDDKRRLGELRGLHAHRSAEAEQEMVAGVGEVDGDQQEEGHADRAQGNGGVLQLAVVGALEGHHEDQGDYGPRGLRLGAVPCGVVGAHLGHDRRCAVDNQHAGKHHGQHGEEKDPIGFESLGHVNLSLAVGSQSV